jgi:PIN domain nuclease of toxin-antitoxin system
MRILLDTHIFLWLLDNDKRLSERYRQLIHNLDNEIFLSVVSIWECVIKYQGGKLNFPRSPEIYLPQARRRHLIKALTVDEDSIAQLIKLPLLHKDPFDRLFNSSKIAFFPCQWSDRRDFIS